MPIVQPTLGLLLTANAGGLLGKIFQLMEIVLIVWPEICLVSQTCRADSTDPCFVIQDLFLCGFKVNPCATRSHFVMVRASVLHFDGPGFNSIHQQALCAFHFSLLQSFGFACLRHLDLTDY